MRLLAFAILLAISTVAAAGDFKPEPGFELIFNGKDLTGWRTKSSKDKPGIPLDGKTEAYNGRFKVKDSELVLDPSVKGDVRIVTAKEFGKDVVIKFDFKPGPGCNNDLFLLGTKFDIISDPKTGLKNVKEGEWNTIEIVARDGQVEHKVNGETARKPEKAKVEKSVFEIRAEFGPIQIRRLRVKEGG